MDFRGRRSVFSFKKIFTKGLILAIFNPAKKIIIEIDVNKIIWGAVLS